MFSQVHVETLNFSVTGPLSGDLGTDKVKQEALPVMTGGRGGTLCAHRESHVRTK